MADTRRRLPYGSWPSPISAAQVAGGGLRFADLQFDGDDLYWVEGRPVEGGRNVVVRYRDGLIEDVVSPPYSARTAVHEYGGGALLVADGHVYFSNHADRRLYRVDERVSPRPLTPDIGDVRYADMAIDRQRNRLICVVEDHHEKPPSNSICTVSLDDGAPIPLVRGNDFYSNPRVSPDGNQVAWMTWNHPNMPWDGSELWLAELDDAGDVGRAHQVAGGPRESIFQPSWSPEGVLHFCSDRTGWWNLYRCDEAGTAAVAPMDAECGKPQFVLRLATYAFCRDGRIALTACRDGEWRLGYVDPGATDVTWFDLPYTATGHIDARDDTAALVAGGPRHPLSVVLVDLATGEHRELRRSSDAGADDSYLSVPHAIAFAGHDGVTSHAFVYAPRNDSVEPDPGSLPPLLVNAHGGPTSAVTTALNLEVQYWTSRGFMYVDVNYGGSTGYGRPYRDRLYGNLGLVDVGDCVAAARSLVDQGRVDPKRLLVQGGSAGGYIVLRAVTAYDAFDAGASYYGIADWEAFDPATHKFESRYNDHLIGPLPQAEALYRARSPIHYIDRVQVGVIFFQGLDDVIVPAEQSEMMYQALRDRGLPCAYLAFAGEQHGFRQAANIERSLEAELYFFAEVLGFDIADRIAPIEIANVEAGAPRI